MKEATALRFFTLSIGCFLLVSVANCSPSRFRRDAAAEPDSIMSTSSSPDSSSMSPSTPSSSSMMMSHEGHKISCDDKDNATLKTSCPSNDMCPSDTETIEKCCHCIGTCCDMSSGDSTESSTEKNIGGKVKDAINSAEGWLKNQGQNIKNQWDKAKEGIKNTATDVKDKVKKGVDSMTTRFRNATGGNSSSEGKTECSDKDGNCSSDTPSIMAGKDDNGSEFGTPMPMTPKPGNQKNKRDVYGASFSSPHQTHYSSFSGGMGDTSDASDSDEYSWSRSTKTTTGNRDSNSRRYKREMVSKSNSVPSNSTASSSSSSTSTPEKSGRTKREPKSERASSTEPSNSTMMDSSTSKNTRNKRGDDRRSDSNSGSLPAVKTSTATTVTEGTVTENGKSSSSSSSSTSSNSRSRNRRELKGMGKNNKDDSTTPSSPDSKTGTSANETESDEGSKEDSFHRGNKYDEEEDGNNPGKDSSRRKDPKLSISVHLLGPPKSNRNSRQSKASKGDRGGENWENHRPTQFPILSPGGGGGRTLAMESNEDDEDVDVVMDHPPMIVYPESPSNHRGSGGVISSSASASSGGSGSGSKRSNKGQYETERGRSEYDRSPHYESSRIDMSSYPMMLVNSESSMMTSPSSGIWRHDSDRGYDNDHRGHGQDNDRQPGTRYMDDFSSQYRYEPLNSSYPSVTVTDGESSRSNMPFTTLDKDMETSRNSSSGVGSMASGKTKPGMCRPLAVGVDCVFLQARAPQCSYDDECPGSMKCCFNTCEPYKHVGICDDSVSS